VCWIIDSCPVEGLSNLALIFSSDLKSPLLPLECQLHIFPASHLIVWHYQDLKQHLQEL